MTFRSEPTKMLPTGLPPWATQVEPVDIAPCAVATGTGGPQSLTVKVI